MQSGLKLSHVQTCPLDGEVFERSRVPWFLLSHGPEAEVRVGVEANLELPAAALTPGSFSSSPLAGRELF